MPAAAPPAELTYTSQEIQSYLPLGWSVYPGDRGGWSGERSSWSIRVLDGARMDWELVVTPDAAGRQGRIEALRQAVDRLFRQRLG
jgi:hypothetical protein